MRFPRPASSLLLAFPLLLAGCSYEQSKPPTPEGLALIKSRTAVGTQYTKLEARPMTNPPRAGEVSIWDLKVFKTKDKENGERNEWKFFTQLPQNGEGAGTTDVLMRAWIISKDRTVFLPQNPSYKAYGSFVTDWTIPKPGEYSIFVEYQPAERGKIYGREMARWDFKAIPNPNAVAETISTQTTASKPVGNPVAKGSEMVSELSSASSQSAEGAQVVFSHRINPKVGDYLELGFKTKDDATLSGHEMSALSPDGKTFLHFVGQQGQMVFSQKGVWDVWITFDQNGEKYTSHGKVKIS